jgi:short subunit dehydrogenase-like uncharacterized protein
MSNQRDKRQVHAGSVDINALQTTINDHRSMINYLINNTINTTVMSNAIMDHHTNTLPILASWRDWIDVMIVLFMIGYVIYKLIMRFGSRSCDSIVVLVSKRVADQMNQEQQHKSTLPTVTTTTMATTAAQTERYHPTRHLYPSVASTNNDDIIRLNNGYASG